jgi:hypothetical protein
MGIRKVTQLLLAAAALGVQGASAGETKGPAMATAGNGAGAWLIAQDNRPTCELDGKRFKKGKVVCHEGRLWKCVSQDTWDKSGKKC